MYLIVPFLIANLCLIQMSLKYIFRALLYILFSRTIYTSVITFILVSNSESIVSTIHCYSYFSTTLRVHKICLVAGYHNVTSICCIVNESVVALLCPLLRTASSAGRDCACPLSDHGAAHVCGLLLYVAFDYYTRLFIDVNI